MKSKPWTKEEERVIREFYPRIKKGKKGIVVWDELLKRLPGRTKESCQVRASRLRVSVRAQWTVKEDEFLLNSYADYSARALMTALPGRSWNSIRIRAVNLGIQDTRWQGYFSMKATADKLGFSEDGLERILDDMGVTIRTRSVSDKKGSKFQHKVIEWDAAEQAVTDWLKLETPRQAAARWGLQGNLVVRWVTAAGHVSAKKGRAVRLDPGIIDEIIKTRKKTWKPRPRKNKRINHGQ